MLKKENLKDIYPLSPMQAGMLFHALYEKESRAYNPQHSFRILEKINISALEASYKELLKRHDVLRSVFVFKNVPEPLQLVLKTQKSEFYFEDLRSLPDSAEQKRHLKTYKQKDLERSFDLSQDTLLRISLFQLDSASFEIIWTNHHIILDGWSLGIILQEFFELYFALKEGKLPNLAPAISYKGYINWFKSQDKEKAKDYWEHYLTGYTQLATLNHNPQKRREKSHLGKEWSLELDDKIVEPLNQLIVHHQVTLNTVIQAIWGILLSQYNHLDEVVFGAVVSGRPEQVQGIEQMVGLFINTVPVRVKISAENTLGEFLGQLQQDALSSQNYHYYPLADIQLCSSLKQHLLDHLVVVDNYPLDEAVKDNLAKFSNGISIDDVEAVDYVHYDFTLMITLFGDNLKCHFLYNGQVYDEAFLQTISGYFFKIAEQITFNPNIKLRDIEMFSAQEKTEIAAKKEALDQITKSQMVAEFDF